MSLDTQVIDAQDLNFIAKVDQAMRTMAISVATEPPNTPNHANRVAYAKAVLGSAPPLATNLGGLSLASTVAAGIVNQGVNAYSTDAAIQQALSATWNAFTGAL